jgi:hypothetical protein
MTSISANEYLSLLLRASFDPDPGGCIEGAAPNCQGEQGSHTLSKSACSFSFKVACRFSSSCCAKSFTTKSNLWKSSLLGAEVLAFMAIIILV